MRSLVLLAALLVCSPAAAQNKPVSAQGPAGPPTLSTVAVTNTFIQVPDSNLGGRNGCTIQYLGGNTGYVYFGTNTAPSGVTTSFQLSGTLGRVMNCQAGGIVLTDPIWVTGTSGDTFVVSIQ
jgi:hypothetical protein